METQKAVFINAGDCTKPTKLIEIAKELIGVDEEPIPGFKVEETESYPWSINTKYYDAMVDITILRKKSIVSEKFAESVEAVLLYFNSEKDANGLETLKSWMSFVEMWQPSIKLAVCEKCDREGVGNLSRVAVQEWCLSQEFELVELNPDMDDYDEFEDVGVKRICNALKAHMWPKMSMKDPQNAVKKVSPNSCGANIAKGTFQAPSENAHSRINDLLGSGEFDDILGNENEEDNFEKLFCKMKVMKEKADSLPQDERKKYAENMVKAFWLALGGDEEEFEGTSSDDEEKKTTEDAERT